MALVEFTISIEVPDSDYLTPSGITQEESNYNTMLSDMEEIIGKKNYALDNAEWNYL